MSFAGPAKPNWPFPGLIRTLLMVTEGKFVGITDETLLEVNLAKMTLLSLNRWSTRASNALLNWVLFGSKTKLFTSEPAGPVLGIGYNLNRFAAMGSTGVPPGIGGSAATVPGGPNACSAAVGTELKIGLATPVTWRNPSQAKKKNVRS